MFLFFVLFFANDEIHIILLTFADLVAHLAVNVAASWTLGGRTADWMLKAFMGVLQVVRKRFCGDLLMTIAFT